MNKIALHGAENHYFEKRIVRIISLGMALALALIFAAAFVFDFQPDRALFESGSVIAGLAFYMSIAFAGAIYLLTFVLVRSEKQSDSTFPAECEYLSYYTLDNAFIKVYRVALAILICIEGCVNAAYVGLKHNSYLILALMGLVAITFAFYFLPELTEVLGSTKIHLGCGMAGMVWLLINTFVSYFDRSYPLASQYMILTQIGYVLALIALTYEIRYRFDFTHMRARLASTCAAFVFNFGFGIGRIFMLMSAGQVSYGDTATAIIMLALSGYFGARIFFYSED